MFDSAPKTIIGETAFGDEAVYVGIPFQRATKGMEDTDESGNKVFGFIHLMKHTQDNTADSIKKTVEERAVIKEEMTELLIDGENAMTVGTVNKLERHASGTFLAIFDTASRAEAAFTAERNKLHVSAVRADIHGTAKRGVTTMNHLRDVFHFNVSGMKGILNYFIVIFKYFLKNVHEMIMK